VKPNPARRISDPTTEDTLTYQIGDKLYINLTDRCTLSCQFCPKHNQSTEVKGHELFLSQRPDVSEIIDLIGDPQDFSEIVFCGYGEPTLRLKPLLQIAQYVKARNGKVRLNTDGLANRFHKRDVIPELASCIDSLSISLNAQNEEIYQQHCKPALSESYNAVLMFIEQAVPHFDEVAVSAIDGLAGVDIDACRELVEQRGATFKRRILDQVG